MDNFCYYLYILYICTVNEILTQKYIKHLG